MHLKRLIVARTALTLAACGGGGSSSDPDDTVGTALKVILMHDL